MPFGVILAESKFYGRPRLLRGAIGCVALACSLSFVTPARGADLRDQTFMVRNGIGLGSVQLETKLYSPLGDGPFPLVVINHGKPPGDPRSVSSSAYYGQALEFVKRGYAVLVPMREGFAKSSGVYRDGNCDVENSSLSEAHDIAAAIDYARLLPFIDASRTVVIGHSQGGLATVALGSLNPKGVVGLISFAGGVKIEGCTDNEFNLVKAVSNFGARSHLPSLWIYGDNDSLFSPNLTRRMRQSYVSSGGNAELIDYGSFRVDAHAMFTSYDGVRIWLPLVAKFFSELGLPFKLRIPLRDPTGLPDVEDVDAVPFVNEKGREAYRRFLWMAPPRAFAISPNGHGGLWNGPDSGHHALAECASNGGVSCRLYANGQDVIR